MTKLRAKDWYLQYPNPVSEGRLLICLPADLLADIHMAAKAMDVSSAEFMRRAATRHILALALHDLEVKTKLHGRSVAL
jgi:hypothetical protein